MVDVHAGAASRERKNNEDANHEHPHDGAL
jgi:hypothetical protein